MQDELAFVEELQRLDLEILGFRNELESIPENIGKLKEDVAHVGEILDKERERLVEAEKWRTERERDIEIQSEMLAKSKTKLQAARNEKESKAAQREIDTIRRNTQDREKEAIELMEAIEQYRSAIEAHEAEFAELEKHLTATEAEGAERMKEIELRIEQTGSSRSELAGRISPKTLRMYERIHRRLGRALVEVAGGFCTGCNMELPPQLYIELQRGDKLLNCPNCFRMLVHKPPESEES